MSVVPIRAMIQRGGDHALGNGRYFEDALRKQKQMEVLYHTKMEIQRRKRRSNGCTPGRSVAISAAVASTDAKAVSFGVTPRERRLPA